MRVCAVELPVDGVSALQSILQPCATISLQAYYTAAATAAYSQFVDDSRLRSTRSALKPKWLLRCCLCPTAVKLCSDGVVAMGVLYCSARALCKQGRIKPGVLLGISDMLQTSKYNDFVPSDTSKLYLDPHNSSISSKQAAKAAGGAATSGKENKAVAAMSGEGKVAAASVEAVAGALQVAPAANSNTVAGVTEVAAKQHQETDGQTAHLVRTSSTTWWPQMLKKYEQMKCMYEKQVQHRRMRATQSTASQRTVSQAAEQRAGQCPSAAASVPTQHENPAVAPATIIEDSQATIKYVTQATEV